MNDKEYIELLVDALDHISRTARGSRTNTRRLRWIEKRAEMAVNGEVYYADSFDLPKIASELTVESLSLENKRLREALQEIEK
jgi:hypothetical protein